MPGRCGCPPLSKPNQEIQMAHGGARPGAGRKKGSGITKTREAAERLLDEGMTPLDYLVGVMRGSKEFEENKFEAAKAAAPYMHARLAAVAHEGKDGGAITVVVRRFGA